MAIINPQGLLRGERLAACSDNAQNWWPRLFLAANGFARIELSYSSIVQECFAGYRKKPTEAQLWDVIEEYETNCLAVVYETADGLTWLQFITPEKCLRKYKTKDDDESPAPPEELIRDVEERYLARKRSSTYRRRTKSSEVSENVWNISESFENVPNSSANFGLGVGVGVGEEHIRRRSASAPSVLAFPGLDERPTDDSEVPDFGTDEIVPQPNGKRSCIRSKWLSDVFAAYPKQEDPDAAHKAIRRALQNLIRDGHDGEQFTPEEAYGALLNATATFASSPKVQRCRDRGEMQYIAKPASWFSRGGHKSHPKEWQ